jgi:alditol oxidase
VETYACNWAGNQQFQAQHTVQPESIEELQELVRTGARVKPIGSRHSFSPIADTGGTLVSMAMFSRILSIDSDTMTATLGAGMPYGLACAELHNAGYAIHNMASLPQITIGGACSTATHGSGDRNGNLATAVTTLRLVTADGELSELDRERNPEDFRAVVVGLGGFGIITDMTLEIRPTFTVRQDIYEDLPLTTMLEHFDEIMALGYSVSLFTDWQGETVNQLWIKRLIDSPHVPQAHPEIFGARLAEVQRHPLPSEPGDRCTEQLGAFGPWHERLPHFRMDSLGDSGEELQTEYFVAREHARDALAAVSELHNLLRPIIKTSEVRTIAADDLWMSPAYASACVGIHFTWQPDWTTVQQALPQIEAALDPFEPRPHWGKLFTIPPARVAERYPRFTEFQNLMHHYDPTGKFSNTFLDRYIRHIG